MVANLTYEELVSQGATPVDTEDTRVSYEDLVSQGATPVSVSSDYISEDSTNAYVPIPQGLQDTGLAAESSIGDTLTLGLRKPAAAAIAALASDEGGKTFSERYKTALAFMQKSDDELRVKSPVASLAGSVAGGIGQAGLAAPLKIGSAFLPFGKGTIGKYAANVGASGLVGGAYNAVNEAIAQATGMSEPSAKRLVDATKTGATVGGVAGAVLGPAGYLLSRAVSPAVPIISKTGQKLSSQTARGVQIIKNYLSGKAGAKDAVSKLSNAGKLGIKMGAEADDLIQAAGSSFRRDAIEPAMRKNNAEIDKLFNMKRSSGLRPADVQGKEIYKSLNSTHKKTGIALDRATDDFLRGVPETGISLNSTALSPATRNVLEKRAAALQRTDVFPSGSYNTETNTISPQLAQALRDNASGNVAYTAAQEREVREFLTDQLNKLNSNYKNMMKDYELFHQFKAGVDTFSPAAPTEMAKAINKSGFNPPSGTSSGRLKELRRAYDLGQEAASLSHKYQLSQPKGRVSMGNSPIADMAYVTAGTPYGSSATGARALYKIAEGLRLVDKNARKDYLSRALNLNRSEFQDYLDAFMGYRPTTHTLPAASVLEEYEKWRENE